MNQNFIEYTHELFKKLIELYGFKVNKEVNEGQSYMIEYNSKYYVIKIEKYFREFYAILYNINNPDYEINLFNLLEYLKQGDLKIPVSEYFHNEKDIEKCYQKQLNHIASVIYENYDIISNFFDSTDYALNIIKFEKYWKNKYPEFYKTW